MSHACVLFSNCHYSHHIPSTLVRLITIQTLESFVHIYPNLDRKSIFYVEDGDVCKN